MVDKHMNEEAFMTYLATKVSPAQLSAIYWCYGEIEAFFLKIHALNKPLFETIDMDTATKIKNHIEQNFFFKIKYRKQYAKMMTAWGHYYSYIKEGLYPKDEPAVSTSVPTNEEAKTIQPEPADEIETVQPEPTDEIEAVLLEPANEVEAVLPEPVKTTQGEAVAEEQVSPLEDRLRDALKTESEQNQYGTTLLFLQQSVECRDANAVRSILLNAKWAKFQYGRFFYIDEAPEPVAEKSFDTSVEKPNSEKALSSPETQIKQEHNELHEPMSEEKLSQSAAKSTVSFEVLGSYAFTRPETLSYFGEDYAVKSWAQLYVQTAHCLYEDYPDVIEALSKANVEQRGRIDIGDKSMVSQMTAPKELSDGYYLETNLSATDIILKIKQLLDLCRVDYENVVITYFAAKQESNDNAQLESFTLVDYLTEQSVYYVDNRDKGGCFWIRGKQELQSIVDYCRENFNIDFHFKEEGSRSLDGEAGWWTNDSVDAASQQVHPSPAISAGTPVLPDSNAFLRWMLDEQHMSVSSGRSYASGISNCEQMARQLGLAHTHLYGVSYEEARKTADLLMQTSRFKEVNGIQHHRFSASISKYLQFLSCDTNSSFNQPTPSRIPPQNEPRIKQEPMPIKQESKDVYELLHDEEFRPLRDELVRQNIITLEALRATKLWPFMNRYNLYSIGKRQAILEKVQLLLNPEMTLDDNQLYVLHIGPSAYKGTTAAEAYLHFCEDMARRYPLQFRTLIGTRMSREDTTPIFKSGDNGKLLKLENINACISADLSATVVLHYARWICGMCGNKNVEAFMDEPKRPASEPKLASLPSPETPESALAVQPVIEQPQLKNDNSIMRRLEQYVLKADMDGVSDINVRDAMGLTMVATKQLIAEAVHIVDIKGRLIHEDAFVDWEEGADRLEAIIDKLIQKNDGYISCSQLYEYARTEMNMFLNDNGVNEERAVYDIARHLFEKAGYHGKHYSFYGHAHISRPEDAISSNFDIIKKFASEQGEVFSFTALSEYLESLGLSSGNLRAQMRLNSEPVFFYYDDGILMFSENMHIDAAWKASVKTSLEALFSDVGDHIILREIPAIWFDRLPSLPGSRTWTPLLLQSILRFYDKELGARTILAMDGQSIETLHSMLVSNSSPIQGFGDVVISYLVDNEIGQRDFEAEDLRGHLVNAGIIKGNELIGNMTKALKNDERFAWDAAGSHVTVKVG